MDDQTPQKYFYDLSENEDLSKDFNCDSFQDFNIELVLNENEDDTPIESNPPSSHECKQMTSQTTTISAGFKTEPDKRREQQKLKIGKLMSEINCLETKILLQRQSFGVVQIKTEVFSNDCTELIPFFTDLSAKIDDFRYTYFARSDNLREENILRKEKIKRRQKQINKLDKKLLAMSIKFSEMRKIFQKKSKKGFFGKIFG